MINLIKSHRSIRKFTKQEVTPETVTKIIEAGQWAPTSHHIQAYSIIVVKDLKKRKQLAQLAGGQAYVESCPVFFVICADFSRLYESSKKHGQPFEVGEAEQVIVGAVDAALVAENMLLAARSYQLGGVMIGGIRNDLESVSILLNLPQYTFPVMGLCIGYPDQQPRQKPRLPQSVVVHYDEYDQSNSLKEINEYDQVMSHYYKSRTQGKRKDTWTELMAKHFSTKSREGVGDFLKKQGFLQE
ncbi:oxygen-insensitive NADPH nitroreductase [Halalkalibacter sp. APA_J-10(15)]|uniref:oxygen-insensitive NADPH nitroreductase n=1 Tax=Halalkalibacter sp. APA_J-10(15) TaxID=2933805 RepID=UPI001FF1A2EE|nr:oxygen-insensitive NADPH nitroreductase [Halalkalibacter sp. APA_J-10(15)]MCK0470365.1 oxygen-insensitive NADPH nitroreductase [Halalkalibacter sp. APA_J-10(15)]